MLALAVRLMIAAAVLAGCATTARIESPTKSTVTLAAVRPLTVAPPATTERGVQSAGQLRPGDTLWTIERGSYTGMTIPLRFNSALGSGRDPEHFWRLPSEPGEDAGVVGWNSDRFPIPLAFRHDGRLSEITASDSSAFWAIVGDMASDLGIAVFRPTTIGPSEDPEDVVVVDIRFMPQTDGLSRTTWKPSGELFDVRVTFRETETLHNRHVVSHEMMHALGFGHTKEWKSVVNRSPSDRLTRLSPDDVAYAQAAMVLRRKREQYEMRRLITMAVAQESGGGDLLRQLGADGLDWHVGVFDDDTVPECARIPADLIAVVPECGKGLH